MLVEGRDGKSDATTMALVDASDSALAAGRASDAEDLARRAIERDAVYVPARLALGRALEAAGRHADAAATYAGAARVSPLSPGVDKSLRRVWLAPLAGFWIVAAAIWFIFRIVERQFDQHTVLFALLISTGILVAGTLVLLHQRRRRFAGLSVEDRRLLDAYGTGGLVGGRIGGRLATVAFVIVVLSGAAVIFAIGTKPSLLMKVGDCFTIERNTTIEQVSAIPCALPHGTEIFATVEDPSVPEEPYPGIDAVRAAATPICLASFKAFTGVDYQTPGRWFLSILSPEEPYWVIGVRTNWCTVQRWGSTQTTGSARDTGD